MAETKKDFTTAGIRFANSDQAAFDAVNTAALIAFMENGFAGKELPAGFTDIHHPQFLFGQNAPFGLAPRLAGEAVSGCR